MPRRKQNAVQKLQKFLATLDHYELLDLWRIATALRGPDSEHYGQKEASWAIRDAIQWSFEHFGKDYRPRFDAEVFQVSKNTHYRSHIHGALCVLSRLGVEIPKVIKEAYAID